jgi:Domain of unknown function (DUF4440)
MKILLLALFGMLLLASSCSQKPPASSTGDVEQVKKELQDLERRLIVAVQRKDMDTLNDIWLDEYFGTAPNGQTVTKKDLMAAVKDGVIQVESIEPEDLYVRLFGEGTVAIMTGKTAVVATVLDEPYRANVRGTGIFVKRDGKWHIGGVHVGPDTKTPLVDDSKMKAEQEKK